MAPPTSTTEGDLPTQLVVVFEGGEVRTPLRQEVALGDPVAISVTSDIADEVHLHTYDLMVDVAAGETVTLEFSATIPGIFEMELESAHLQVLELVVQ